MSTIGDRLKQERSRLGLNQTEFAALGFVTKDSQLNYEVGRRSPDSAYLSALADHGVDVLYVLTGRRERGGTAKVLELAESGASAELRLREHPLDMGEDPREQLALREDRNPTLPIEIDGALYAHVPLHEATLGAGPGRFNATGPVAVDHLAFRRDWLRRIGVSPNDAVIARVSGDSMAPTIHDGDVVLVDISRAAPPDKPRAPKDTRPAQIYAVLDGELARVKRVELAAPGTLALLSDNPASPPEFRPLDQVSIIGRVLWWGHTNRE